MKILISFIFIITSNAYASSLCTPIKSSGEGHWPIPEEKFTLEAAKEASINLNKYLSDLKKGEEYFAQHYGLDSQSLIFNELTFIKGYTLKTAAESNLAINNKYAKHSINEFCQFLKNEAHVWH